MHPEGDNWHIYWAGDHAMFNLGVSEYDDVNIWGNNKVQKEAKIRATSMWVCQYAGKEKFGRYIFIMLNALNKTYIKGLQCMSRNNNDAALQTVESQTYNVT